MKNFIYLGLLIFLLINFNTSNAYSQEANRNTLNTTQNQLPADFPKYVNSGNEKEDIKIYNQAKLEWIEKNKEIYDEISNSIKSQNKQARPKFERDIEYQMTSPEKQNYIKEEPQN